MVAFNFEIAVNLRSWEWMKCLVIKRGIPSYFTEHFQVEWKPMCNYYRRCNRGMMIWLWREATWRCWIVRKLAISIIRTWPKMFKLDLVELKAQAFFFINHSRRNTALVFVLATPSFRSWLTGTWRRLDTLIWGPSKTERARATPKTESLVA